MFKRDLMIQMSAVLAAISAVAPQAVRAESATAALEDVIVTANRRVEDQQNVPLAITTVDASDLQRQNVTEMRDLQNLVPGVQIYPIQNVVQIAVRGLGSSFLDPRGDGTVVTSLDGLYFPRPAANGGSFYDISRVEVLKGPQGTLYGRNAAAGAVNIITNRPNFDGLSGYLEAQAGNFGLRSAQGALNVTLNDEFAVRGAFQVVQRDGYVGDFYNDADSVAGRISATWKPNDKLSIYGTFSDFHAGGAGHSFFYSPCGAEPWTLQAPSNATTCVAGGVPMSKFGQQDHNITTALVQVDYDFGFATLTSLTGYVATDTKSFSRNGNTLSTNLLGETEDYTQELRLTSNSTADHAGGLAWVVGAYYLDGTAANQFTVAPGVPNLNFVFGASPRFTDLPQTGRALFAQGTYGLTDNLRATLGIRYSEDDKGATFVSARTDTAEASFENTTYRAGLEYDLTDDSMIYGQVSTGYISGGVNGGNPALPVSPTRGSTTFPAEKNTAFEIGSKNRFFGGKLQLNADAYLYQFEHYQLFVNALYNSTAVAGSPSVGVSNSVITDAGDVTTYGAEASMVWLATPDDLLTMSLTYAHGEFDKLEYVGSSGPPNAAQPSRYTFNGNPALVNLPEATVMLGYEHKFHLADGSQISASVNSRYSGEYWLVAGSDSSGTRRNENGTSFAIAPDPKDRQDSFTMTDVSLQYNSPGEHFSVQLWGRNLEDEAVNIQGQAPGRHLYAILPPRTYGVTVRASF